MAKPQQPEIARSGRGASDPPAIKSEPAVPPSVSPEGAAGPVPEDNQPGHRPDHDQDKPSGDAFLQKLHEHAQEEPDEAASGSEDEPEPTVAGDALRAAAGVVRKVREALPGD